MKTNELRELSLAELEQKKHELSEDMFQTRLKFLAGEMTNTAKLKSGRRDLARVNTLVAQKRKAEAK